MADYSPPPSSSPSPRTNTSAGAPSSERWKRIGIIAGGVLVLVLIAYFVGLMQGRGPIAGLEEEVAVARQAQQELQAQLGREEARTRMTEALALLYRATLDLDERNFGTANARLQQAAQTLAQIDPAAAGAEVQQLRQEISAMNVEVAANLQAQRSRILSFAETLKGKIPAMAVEETAVTLPDSASG